MQFNTATQGNNGIPSEDWIIRKIMGKTISIKYTDKSNAVTTREITPSSITYVGHHRALKAFCHFRNEERTFLLSRLKILGTPTIIDALDDERARHESDVKSGFTYLCISVVIFILSLSGCAFAHSNITASSVHVSGYTRSDGTYVGSYNRRPAGSVSHDAPYSLLNMLCFATSCVGVIMFVVNKSKRSNAENSISHISYLRQELEK